MDRRREVERWLAVREREGLTFRELSKRSGISAGTLGHWAWKLRRERGRAPRGERGFVELVADEARAVGADVRTNSRVEIVLQGERRVIVDVGVDADALARILAAVERC